MQRVSIFLFAICCLLFLSSCEVTTGADSYTNGSTSGGDSVVGSSSVSSQYIENVLTTNGSPAAGTGYALYSYGVQYNIDPAFALAFFLHESSYGKHGVACSSL